jgi:hypothetical protein
MLYENFCFDWHYAMLGLVSGKKLDFYVFRPVSLCFDTGLCIRYAALSLLLHLQGIGGVFAEHFLGS